MRLRFVLLFLIVAAVIAACQGPPPTQIVMVVTATPEVEVPTQTPFVIVVTATAAEDITTSLTPPPTAGTPGTPTQMPPQSPFTPLPVLNAYPTSTYNQIQVAEQVFEGGRMFWLQPTRQLWIMVESGTLAGRWFVFDDNFQEGEAETDPSISPPDGFMQPIRGFGKLWRENPQVREALGWAIASEIGYVSNYEYHPGGALNERGLYIAAPGYHILYTQTNRAIRFDENTWTWRYIDLSATATASPTPTP